MSKEQKLSTESYKGVRDFYPEDMAIQRYIFDTWSKTAESFGFERYDASVLELSDLYKSKGAENEEMVNEQTYTFIDRGEREVTLRPEMTPTVARMVAGKRRELTFPLRWYSIPNLFRYERPQRGRLREHWQFNADIFGSHSSMADTEIILLASEILKGFGAKESDFEIRVNSRKLWNAYCDSWKLSDDQRKNISGLVDRKNKISGEEFILSSKTILQDETIHQEFCALMDGTSSAQEKPEHAELMNVIESLHALGVQSATYDPTIMRGFNYYTGTVFEIFDTNLDNRRALLGGGRYDNLTGLFGGDPIPAVGFGMGDVTMRDFLESHNLLPQNLQGVDIVVIPMSEEHVAPAEKIAATTRAAGKKTYVSLADKKVGEHIKQAEARHARAIIVVGEEEIASGIFTLKTLADGSTTTGSIEDLLK
jgi:histidyl-tRNA synthetase